MARIDPSLSEIEFDNHCVMVDDSVNSTLPGKSVMCCDVLYHTSLVYHNVLRDVKSKFAGTITIAITNTGGCWPGAGLAHSRRFSAAIASRLAARSIENFDSLKAPETRAGWAFESQVFGKGLISYIRVCAQRFDSHLQFVGIAIGSRNGYTIHRRRGYRAG